MTGLCVENHKKDPESSTIHISEVDIVLFT